MVRVPPPRSMAEVPFRIPLVVLPLAVGRGVQNWMRNSITVEIKSSGSMVLRRIPNPPYHSTFSWGGGGVRNSVACEVGPLPVVTSTVSRFPLATYITPKRVTGLFLIGGSPLLLRFVPNDQLLNW
jgi:hypothetical protein